MSIDSLGHLTDEKQQLWNESIVGLRLGVSEHGSIHIGARVWNCQILSWLTGAGFGLDLAFITHALFHSKQAFPKPQILNPRMAIYYQRPLLNSWLSAWYFRISQTITRKQTNTKWGSWRSPSIDWNISEKHLANKPIQYNIIYTYCFAIRSLDQTWCLWSNVVALLITCWHCGTASLVHLSKARET